MSRSLLLIAVTAVPMLAIAGEAEAQVVTITKTNYKAESPPKANPEGTYSTPLGTVMWQVVCGYGALDNGKFTYDASIGTGGTQNIPPPGGNGKWGPFGQDGLKDPLPANTHIRAQLQERVQNQWVTRDTAYEPIP